MATWLIQGDRSGVKRAYNLDQAERIDLQLAAGRGERAPLQGAITFPYTGTVHIADRTALDALVQYVNAHALPCASDAAAEE